MNRTVTDLLFAALGIGSGLYLIMTGEGWERTTGYLGIVAGTFLLTGVYRRAAEEVEALEQEVNNDDHGL